MVRGAERRRASEALTRAQEQLEAAKRACEAQAQREEEAQRDFRARLDEVGLDKAGYDTCKAHFLALDADGKKVTDLRDDLIPARTTWEIATATCAHRVRPDLGRRPVLRNWFACGQVLDLRLWRNLKLSPFISTMWT